MQSLEMIWTFESKLNYVPKSGQIVQRFNKEDKAAEGSSSEKQANSSLDTFWRWERKVVFTRFAPLLSQQVPLLYHHFMAYI